MESKTARGEMGKMLELTGNGKAEGRAKKTLFFLLGVGDSGKD